MENRCFVEKGKGERDERKIILRGLIKLKWVRIYYEG